MKLKGFIKVIDKLSKISKNIYKIFLKPPTITFIVSIYTTYYYLFLGKIGIPVEVLGGDALLKAIESTLLGIILILFAVLLKTITLTLIPIAIIFAIIFAIIIAIIFAKIFKRKQLILYFLKNFDIYAFKMNFIEALKFAKDILIMLFRGVYIPLIFLFLISEPVLFILDYLQVKKDLSSDNSIFSKFIKFLDSSKLETKFTTISTLHFIYPSLTFKYINDEPSFMLGIKNDVLYYYNLYDLVYQIKENKKDLTEKNCNYCTNLKNLEEVNFSKEEKLFYLIFLYPSYCNIYPLEHSQKYILRISFNRYLKVEDLDTEKREIIEKYIDELKSICQLNNETNLK